MTAVWAAFVGAGAGLARGDSVAARGLGSHAHPMCFATVAPAAQPVQARAQSAAATLVTPAAAAAPTRFARPALAGASVSRVLMWFQADLRVEDNDALAAAAAAARAPGGALVPVYSARMAMRTGAAQELRASLQRAGSDVVAVANTGAQQLGERLLEIARELQLQAVFYNRAALPDDAREQRVVLSVLERAGIQARAYWGNALCEPPPTEQQQLCASALAKYVAAPRAVRAPRAAEKRLPALSNAARQMADAASDAALTPKTGCGASVGARLLQELTARDQALRVTVAGAGGADVALKFKAALDSGAISLRACYARVCELLENKPRGYLFSELVFRSYACCILQRSAARSAAPAH